MRGSSDESPFYVSKKEQEMSMEIYLITAGALFLFYYGILCFYTGKWDSTFARFWMVAGIGHFLMIPATKEEVTRKLLFFCVAGLLETPHPLSQPQPLSHPHPQFVAAKSLMFVPPKESFCLQFMI